VAADRPDDVLEAFARGRTDIEFFCWFFLGLRLHEGQAEWMRDAVATVNVAATANRWGKTTLLPAGHYHSCFYKIGGEPKYATPGGDFDYDAFRKLRYHTVHTAGEWETAAIVHNEAMKLLKENPRLSAFILKAPLSKPPHIEFANGAVWKFRTLGHDASGIDGNSFYLISVDEAGWIDSLEEKMNNVIRVRVADVQGRIWLVGTFKPGISKDFYKYAVRAAAYTGRGIRFDHSSGDDDEAAERETLDDTLIRYLAEAGITRDEYEDAVSRYGVAA
jgi:hypothetical protein